MAFPKNEAENLFRALVLSGIWMLARLIAHKQSGLTLANNWRGNALNFMDEEGNQSESAPEYRRTHTFPPIYMP